MDKTIPDLRWYKAQSRLEGGPPRCPFASCQSCEKYADSVQVMAIHHGWEDPPAPDPAANRKDRPIEEGPHVMLVGEKQAVYSYRNFCPEVTGERFGFFTSYLRHYTEEMERLEERKQLLQLGIDKSYPSYQWAGFKSQHYTDCQEYSVLLSRRDQRTSPKYDLRGSQFGGGFSETTQGNQTGGQIHNRD